MYDKETILRARQTDLVSYLHGKGEILKKCGSEYCLAEHDSLKINGSKWYWFSQGYGGNAIDFLVKYYGLSFKDAVEELTGESVECGVWSVELANATGKGSSSRSADNQNNAAKPHINSTLRAERAKTPNSTLTTNTMPLHADNCDRALAYLTKRRGLDKALVLKFMNEGYIYQDIKGNCVFVIRDFTTNEPIGYELRGTGKQKFCRISAHRGFGFNVYCPAFDYNEKPESVLFFESAIDLLSYYQLHKPHANELLVSMGGVNPSVVEHCAELFPEAELVICSDNDEAGNTFAAKIAERFPDRTKRKAPPEEKDWNDFIRKRAGGE